MFRKIRKTKSALSEENTKLLLKSERRGVLSVNGDNGYPYAIPINYFYCEKENKVYFHGAKVGHKVDSINKSDKVCFTVYGNEKTANEEWAPYVQSVVIFGRCRIIKNQELNVELVAKFAEKYYPGEELIRKEVEIAGKTVQMYEIEIEHMTGKEIQER